MKKIHNNIPQLEFAMVRPQFGIGIMSRATGKTEVIGANFTLTNVTVMPGSLGGVVCISYDKILNMIIPALKEGWKREGLKENVHYWVRKKPPEKLNIPKAYREPDTSDHLIKFWNGSAIMLISIDRIHIANGSSLCWLFADEVKFFPRDKFKEVLLARRGQAHLFGHRSECESVLLTTDQPTLEMPGAWIYELEKNSDPERAGCILALQRDKILLKQNLARLNGRKGSKKIAKQIEELNAELNMLRFGLTYVIRASTLDNVETLGLNVIRSFQETLQPYDFALSVLNIKPKRGQNSFYYLLDEERHGYYAPNIEYIDSLKDQPFYTTDCRWDADLINEMPMEISADYNSAINWLVIGQEGMNSFSIINSMFVKKPKKISDLAKDFDEYYSPKKEFNNTLIYHYDNTAVGEDAKSDISFADEYCQCLMNLGWNVIQNYIGQASTHRSRFLLYEKVFGNDPSLPKLKFNRRNNIDLLISMNATQTMNDLQGKFKKDKTPERKKSVIPEHATHAGEALDTLIFEKYKRYISPSFLLAM